MSDDSPRPPPIGFRNEFAQLNEMSHFPPGYDLTYGVGGGAYPMPMPTPSPVTDPTLDESFTYIKEKESSSSSSSEENLSEPPIISNIPLDVLYGHSWQSYSFGNDFPPNVVRCGTDADGTPIFAGRAWHNGDLIPAKIMPDKEAAYVAYGGEEVQAFEVEVLRTGTFVWEYASEGNVPEDAVVCGSTTDGEKLYFGRCLYEGSQTPGKIQCSHGCLYIPYNGEEVSVTEYEVLVLK